MATLCGPNRYASLHLGKIDDSSHFGGSAERSASEVRFCYEIFGLGAVMPPLAGALGIHFGRFLIFDGVGSLIYGSVYIGAGFLFHNQLQQVLASLNHLGFSLLVLLLGFIPAYIGVRYVHRRSASLGRRNHEPNQRKRLPLESGSAAVLYQRIQPTEKGCRTEFSDLSRSFARPQPVPPSAHSPTTI